MIVIKPTLINETNFRPFGTIISTHKKKAKIINDGFAAKYENLVNLQPFKNKGSVSINIYQAKKRTFPLRIDRLEMHPLSSQAFISLEHEQFICCVSLAKAKPNIKDIRAFIVPKGIGIIYTKKVWHYPLISLKNMQFLIIERKGKGKNLVEHYSEENIKLIK